MLVIHSYKPSHYDLSLHNITLGGEWTYDGTVKITLDIKESVQEIVLNAAEIKVKDAEIITEAGKQSQGLQTTDISYDTKKNRVTLKFPESLPTTKNVVLTVNFTGILNHEMGGFYRSEYRSAAADTTAFHDGTNHHMFSTQFESSDARRAFPCMDEPNLKAELTLSLEIPEDQTAISNMPVKETKKSSRDGWKIVEFEKAPKMSTYLYAWAFGDFEYIEDHTKRAYQGKRLPVRVYTTKGLSKQGAFALENAHKVIDLFSDVFGVEYPLPKSDLLAVHEFSAGGMSSFFFCISLNPPRLVRLFSLCFICEPVTALLMRAHYILLTSVQARSMLSLRLASMMSASSYTPSRR